MGISRKSFSYKGICSFKDIKEEATEDNFLLLTRLGEDEQKIR